MSSYQIANVEHAASYTTTNPTTPTGNLFGAHPVPGNLNQRWKVPNVGAQTTIFNEDTGKFAVPGDGIVKGGEEPFVWVVQPVPGNRFKIIGDDGLFWELLSPDPDTPIQLVSDEGSIPGQYQWTFIRA